ncbi:MAG: Glycosyl transferase, family 2, partial [uncultured Solirubrobacteraceae bacterium]
GRRGLLLRGQHGAARAAAAGARRARARAGGGAVRDRGARARQRVARRLGRRGARAPHGHRGHPARPAAREGGERLGGPPARPRPLRADAQRGLRAPARRDGRAARRAARPPARGRGRRDAAAPRRCGAALGVALPRPARCAADRAHAAPALRRPELREPGPRGRLGAVGGAARAHGGGALDRVARPGLLRLLRRGRLPQAPARRRLERPLRAAGARGPPRAALDGDRPDTADRRDGPQPRPLHAQAPHGGRRARGALADRVDLRGARARGARPARPRPAALPRARAGEPAPGPRRGAARGGGGVQPRARNL